MFLNNDQNRFNEIINLAANKNILFVGIGNVLRSDDGVGVYICNQIRETKTISTLNVEVSIENYIGKINNLNPDILILLDCMHLNQPPGVIRILQTDEIIDQTFNTHNISLNRLSIFFNMPAVVIGIQPLSLSFGEDLTPHVKKTADFLVDLITGSHIYKNK